MNIGIVGLGLIGGSLAKAYKEENYTVYGYDKDTVTLEYAKLLKSVDDTLLEKTLTMCDVILLALTPDAAIAWLQAQAKNIPATTLVMDCCGTKRKICAEGFALAKKYGFTFVGGHPMAGYQKGGFKHSDAALFEDAPFALVLENTKDIALLEHIKNVLSPVGFSKFIVVTAEEHDKEIAFTSQMAHVVSNAFIKSPTAKSCGTSVSAGSYRDFTRVAYLDAKMWTELFLENKDNLIFEIDTLCKALSLYSEALKSGDGKALQAILEEGKQCKMEVENRCD